MLPNVPCPICGDPFAVFGNSVTGWTPTMHRIYRLQHPPTFCIGSSFIGFQCFECGEPVWSKDVAHINELHVHDGEIMCNVCIKIV